MPILLATTLTCIQVVGILNRITSVTGLTEKQKEEIIIEVRKQVKSCPVKVQKK